MMAGLLYEAKTHPDVLFYMVDDFQFEVTDREMLSSMNYVPVTELLAFLSLLVLRLEPCLNVVIHERCRQYTCQASAMETL